jgi:hypothetical protein
LILCEQEKRARSRLEEAPGLQAPSALLPSGHPESRLTCSIRSQPESIKPNQRLYGSNSKLLQPKIIFITLYLLPRNRLARLFASQPGGVAGKISVEAVLSCTCEPHGVNSRGLRKFRILCMLHAYPPN